WWHINITYGNLARMGTYFIFFFFFKQKTAYEMLPAESTALTANWCRPLLPLSAVYVRGLEQGCQGPFSREHWKTTLDSVSVHSKVEIAVPFGSSGRVVITGCGGATLSIA